MASCSDRAFAQLYVIDARLEELLDPTKFTTAGQVREEIRSLRTTVRTMMRREACRFVKDTEPRPLRRASQPL